MHTHAIAQRDVGPKACRGGLPANAALELSRQEACQKVEMSLLAGGYTRGQGQSRGQFVTVEWHARSLHL